MADQKNLSDKSRVRMMKPQEAGGDKSEGGGGDTFYRFIFDKVLSGINMIGAQAFDEVKSGIDSAWKELKGGVDTGLESATDGIRRGWQELSSGVDRAMDGFMNRQSRSPNS
jgi:hypothetical protein